MKHLKSILVTALVIMVVGVTNAQDKNNPWAVEVGVNAVDTFPVGLRDGQSGKDAKTELFFLNILMQEIITISYHLYQELQ